MAHTDRHQDLTRQIVVISAAVFMLIAAMVGTGLFGGTAVQDLQGGALDADASYLAPARPAFSIWTAIYVLAIAYTVWQALPGQRTDTRQRAVGWWVAATFVLNGLWLVTAQFATLPLTVIVIVALLAMLGFTFHRAVGTPTAGFWDALLIDGAVGLHLGWVSLATVANTAAWLTASDVSTNAPDAWGIAVIAVVAVIGSLIPLVRRSARIAPGLAIAWGLVWLGVARITGEPHSTPIAVAAFVAAGVVLIVPIAMRAVVGTRRAVTA